MFHVNVKRYRLKREKKKKKKKINNFLFLLKMTIYYFSLY